MTADQIRAAFIKRQLARALRTRNRGEMARVSREFRRYLQWCGQSLSTAERKNISRLLSRIERTAGGHAALSHK